jgi:hypothetical protein
VLRMLAHCDLLKQSFGGVVCFALPAPRPDHIWNPPCLDPTIFGPHHIWSAGTLIGPGAQLLVLLGF